MPSRASCSEPREPGEPHSGGQMPAARCACVVRVCIANGSARSGDSPRASPWRRAEPGPRARGVLILMTRRACWGHRHTGVASPPVPPVA